MFATFDDTAFPLIRVRLGSISDDDDFFIFLKQWESYDSKYENYTFVFDTTNVGYIPIKYAYKMSLLLANSNNARRFIIMCIWNGVLLLLPPGMFGDYYISSSLCRNLLRLFI